MSIYLKADGVKGNSSTQGFEDWVGINHFRFGGISQSIAQTTGRLKSRVQNVSNFGFIVLEKNTDISTPTWFTFSHSGEAISNAELVFTAIGHQPYTFLKIALTNAFVSHFSMEYGANDDHPSETLMLAYESLKVTFIPRKPDNTAGSPSMSGYNLATASKL